jgi:hypothetical protein
MNSLGVYIQSSFHHRGRRGHREIQVKNESLRFFDKSFLFIHGTPVAMYPSPFKGEARRGMGAKLSRLRPGEVMADPEQPHRLALQVFDSLV